VAQLDAPPGSVTIETAAGGDARTGGKELAVGDRLHTEATGGVQLTLKNGAAVALDRATTVEVQPSGLALRAGRLKADVKPQSRDFVVETGEAQVRVLGTSFAVESRPSGTTLVTVARCWTPLTSRLPRRRRTPARWRRRSMPRGGRSRRGRANSSDCGVPSSASG